jgi:integrase
MGQIRQRGHVYWIRYYRGGKLYEESARTTSWEVARDLLRDREGDISKGLPVTPRIGRISIEDGLKDLQTEYQVNARKSKAHLDAKITKHLLPYFIGRRMATITTGDINAYIAHRQTEQASNATINRELAALKRAYTLAMRGGALMRKPYIPMLQEHNVRQGFLEPDQYRSVLDHLPDYLRPVVALAYFTGWRTKSEILPLEWRQVDRKACTIRLDPGTTKNGSGRLFVYADLEDVKTVITAQWASHEALKQAGTICPYVFHHGGAQIKFYRRAWITACRKAGCPGRIMHDLRRTAVRNLVRAGVSERTAMVVSGHKTRSVFDRYDIVSESDIRDAGRKLDVLNKQPLAQAK